MVVSGLMPFQRAHAVLTLIIYSLVNAYKSQRGQRLAHLGIRRWRGKHPPKADIK